MSVALRIILLYVAGQVGAPLSPLAGLLPCRGSRCFFFLQSAFDLPQALGALVSVRAQIWAGRLPAADR